MNARPRLGAHIYAASLASGLFLGHPPGEPGPAAAGHDDPGRLSFGDLRLELAAATVLEVEGVEVGQEEWHPHPTLLPT